MKYTHIRRVLILSFVLTPLVSFAALDGVRDILISVRGLLNLAIPMAFACGVLFFFWGIAQFILASGNPSAKAQSKDFLVWGVVALFVMASVWGLVKFLGVALGIDTPVQGSGQQNPLPQTTRA